MNLKVLFYLILLALAIGYSIALFILAGVSIGGSIMFGLIMFTIFCIIDIVQT